MFKANDVDACDIKACWIRALLRKSEILMFVKVRNLKNLNLELENNGSEQMRTIRIIQCKEMEYLVDGGDENIPWSRCSTIFSQLEILELYCLDNLKDICHKYSKIEAPLLFRNLIGITISECSKLKSVFPLSLARGLIQLQWLNIIDCTQIEKVFYTDEVLNDGDIQQMEEKSGKEAAVTMDAIIIFPQLKVLTLGNMPQLRRVYDGNGAIKLPSLESLEIFKCSKMEALSYGSCTTPILQQVKINSVSLPLGGEEDVNVFLKNKT